LPIPLRRGERARHHRTGRAHRFRRIHPHPGGRDGTSSGASVRGRLWLRRASMLDTSSVASTRALVADTAGIPLYGAGKDRFRRRRCVRRGARIRRDPGPAIVRPRAARRLGDPSHEQSDWRGALAATDRHDGQQPAHPVRFGRPLSANAHRGHGHRAERPQDRSRRVRGRMGPGGGR